MIKDEIKMISENSERFDKKQIALAIRNSTLDDELGCSLLEEGIIKDCERCSLRCICNGIDEVTEAYIQKITKVVSTFSFE
jgi:hypothetical protein